LSERRPALSHFGPGATPSIKQTLLKAFVTWPAMLSLLVHSIECWKFSVFCSDTESKISRRTNGCFRTRLGDPLKCMSVCRGQIRVFHTFILLADAVCTRVYCYFGRIIILLMVSAGERGVSCAVELHDSG